MHLDSGRTTAAQQVSKIRRYPELAHAVPHELEVGRGRCYPTY